MSEIADNLARALGRIEDFQAVNADAGDERMREAADLLQEAVGIGEHERVALSDGLEGLRGFERSTGAVFLGVIVGLMAAEGF